MLPCPKSTACSAIRKNSKARATPTDFLQAAPRVIVNDIMAVKETAPQFVDSFEDHARAVLQVQNGCDHRCTFCIIPYGRGNSRSVGAGAVIEEARRLVAAGI
jgi:threonylcarbamoyladenosine tRNA methylthiotransferase MtaB